MKKCKILFFVFIFLSRFLQAQEETKENIEKVLISKLGAPSSNKEQKEKNQNDQGKKNITFIFKDTDLVDVINMVAAEKDVNILLPSGDHAIKSKLTITIPDKLSVDEAWNILYTILDVAGYALVDKGDAFAIVKIDNNIARQPMRIFISEPFNSIPDTDERIVYLAYFENMQVPSAGGSNEGPNAVQEILKNYLSKDVADPVQQFKFIPSANGVMMVDKASNIRAVVKILAELDKVGIKEHLEIIRLDNTSSYDVAKIFNDTILEKTQRRTFRLGARRKSEIRYFERGTKIVSDERTNSLILLGNKDAIQKIKQFIFKYIDVPIESGQSIIHRKQLQYMDPNKIKQVLDNILKGASEGVQARAGASGSGAERFFQGVIVETDYPAEGGGEGEEGKYKYYGTNSLLIAAKNDDWERLDKFITLLDQPLKQIIVEVLIVDIRLDTNKVLGGQTRNPALAPLLQLSKEGGPVEFQSAQLASPVTEKCNLNCNISADTPRTSATLDADLMKGVGSETDPNPFLTGAAAGSTLLTLSDKDGRTWSVLKLLSAYNHAKVLSHPYVVTVNNKMAKVEISETRRLRGAAEQTTAGAAEVKIVNVPAKVGVTIKPRIGASNTVNMEVTVQIEEFESSASENRFKREVVTNANVATDEILVLGGLIRDEYANSEFRSPVLGRIPVLGWFFKSRGSEKIKNNLTVFIRPTIVEPQLRGGMGVHTEHYIKMAKQYSEEGKLFEGLRDPVTRWFFKSEAEAGEVIDYFKEQNTRQQDLEIEFFDEKNQISQMEGKQENKNVNLANNADEHVIVVDNAALQAKNVLDSNLNDEKLDCQMNVDATLECATQSVVAIKKEKGHDSLKTLLQNEQNPFLSSVS